MPSQMFTETGTAGDDFVLGFSNASTFNGGDGDDFILADSGFVPLVGTTNSLAAPENIDNSAAWTRDENPFIANATATPHISLYVLTDAGQRHYSSVTVGAGQTITIDIDFGHIHPIGTSVDTLVELYDSTGTFIVANDDASTLAGAGGSVSSFDSFLSYSNTSGIAQTYTIAFRSFGGTFVGGETFVANISVTGHAVAAPTVMGNDTITGGIGEDSLAGQGGNDSLNGDAGNDTLFGGSGNDVINGGNDTDTADYIDAASRVVINLGLTAAQNTFGAGSDTLTDVENVAGSTFNDTLAGNHIGNVLYGRSGNDLLEGGGGNDTLLGEQDDDVLNGGSGDDALNGGDGSDTASYMGAAAAVIIALNVATQDTLGAGVDTFTSIENLTGTDFDDQLSGDGNNNVLDGFNGNDVLAGNDGNDWLLGGSGFDSLIGGLGDDRLDGGFAEDTVFYTTAAAGVVVDLSRSEAQNTGGAGTDTLVNIEGVAGSNFNDTLIGNALDNFMSGNDGNDVVFGEGGSDDLDGGSGSDTMFGGSGNDRMTGGNGIFNDSLFGQAGNDSLAGGAGDDGLYGGDSDDTLVGWEGNDTLDGGTGQDTAVYAEGGAVAISLAVTAAQDTLGGGIDTLTSIENLVGSSLADTLTGNAEANLLDGADGNDILTGGHGNDTLFGGVGDDSLDGGFGNDTASYRFGFTAFVSLALSGPQNTGDSGFDTLTNIENLIGSVFGDTLTGNAGINILSGGVGHDTLNGGDGNDTVVGGSGDDVLDGGTGNDTASYIDNATFIGVTTGVTVNLALVGAQNTGSAGIDTLTSIERLTGSTLGDTLTGNGGVNVLSGEAGIDLVDGAAGDDSLLGGDGNDRLIGGAGNDSLNGGAGFDTASYVGSAAAVTVNLGIAGAQNTGGAGSDSLISIERATGSAFNDALTGNPLANVLSGEGGNDALAGDSGDDSLLGGDGTDLLIGGNGNDSLNGGNGVDTASYTVTSSAVTVSLALTAAQDTVGAGTDTLLSIENLLGSGFNDTLTGNSLANTLDGRNGNDALIGGGGSDVLDAGNGNDLLVGGAGNDSLSGGAGADLFRFDSALSAATNVDGIIGYSVADDSIQLSQAVFAAVGPLGALSAAAFRAGASAADASDRIIYNSANGRVYYDADGNGAGAQVLFAQVTAGTALTNADFLIIG